MTSYSAMHNKILDGQRVADAVLSSIKKEIESLRQRKPCLAVVLVGDDPASAIYVKRKTKACLETGFESIQKIFPATVSEEELTEYLLSLNASSNVDGILVQLPLPAHLNQRKITSLISPDKDVDGFHPVNLGKLVTEDSSGYVPCTPLGVKELLEASSVDLAGKHAVIVGRSTIVGKPLSLLLLQKQKGMNATVTCVHSYTHDLPLIVKQADLVVAAIGRAEFIRGEWIKEGAVVIDVGINRVEDASAKKGYRIVGDVEFEGALQRASLITKVPGGVGPMTIAMLLKNTYKSYKSKGIHV
ncbi:bifunctional methylenetetrahydrofolate dehydrogenase/methenyltetrahydrofolate cyclohydrolase FolD [Estrella lausannensis]|uniref:Bifunctional protein FolD n=1 Tax=Estrella lausannensis TaxID=483423 RepID=A0A0H5DP15_9BACT|nr:bifunctional methylenetetrahydrofolate dehydrogenase/methenyltetrahydrofolate cyclohydrolase FolD [Estrella lausannensis]CRX38072.1 Methenyltetrahydrofolate cyclohydrolase/methylenetetrahydrofolate dehydrogenase [Estrella lausannensis]